MKNAMREKAPSAKVEAPEQTETPAQTVPAPAPVVASASVQAALVQAASAPANVQPQPLGGTITAAAPKPRPRPKPKTKPKPKAPARKLRAKLLPRAQHGPHRPGKVASILDVPVLRSIYAARKQGISYENIEKIRSLGLRRANGMTAWRAVGRFCAMKGMRRK